MIKKQLQFAIVALTVLLFTIVIGCAGNVEPESVAFEDSAADGAFEADDAGFNEMTAANEAYEESETVARADSETQMDTKSAQTAGEQSARMVIYNADMTIEVNDFQKTQTEIFQKVEQIGGFVVQSSVTQSEQEDIFGNIVVKVPQAEFHAFLNDLEAFSTKVLDRSVAGNDVTEEYIDLESRLRSRETVEERLLAFMEDANNTEDLLKISDDLAKVQEEMEQLTGQLNYLEHHVAYSTVTVFVHERKVTVPPIQDSGALNTWENAKSLFMSTINVIITFFSQAAVFLIGLSPVLLPAAAISGVVILRALKHKRQSNDISEQ
ncbi:protein of unknown function [Evansella caseinilytica]|uniref:DUF4349 domain-containing protein n=1 Tax=Evansella caseinilytica TaxID=1503961 RepID=A0A1H3RV56_9BACI|nr:DUF4349 domain-containing protein [Evansella caseinilytica]SDZ29522.1 protein of unknown function [Evansella caseinilytica]